MSSLYPPFGGTSVQLCQRCGRPLPPNDTQCNNCGLVNTPPQTNNPSAQLPSAMSLGGPTSQKPFGSGQFIGHQWRRPAIQSPLDGPFNEPSVPQVPFDLPNQLPFPQAPNAGNFYGPRPGQQSGPNNSFEAAVPQQPAPGGFTPGAMGGYPATGFGQAPPTNGYQNAGLTQVPPMISHQQGGFAQPPAMNDFQQGNFTQPPTMNGYQQHGFVQPPTMNNYQPEDFPQPPEGKRRPPVGLIIAIIVILLVVVGGSIGGYVYIKKYSGTVTAQATPTMAPTPTPAGAPLFTDPLLNNNAGWDLTSKPGQFSIKIGGGSMTLEDDNNKLFFELLPGGRNFNDFYLTVDAALTKGNLSNGYGIYFRGASSQSYDIATYYRLELYGDGTYAIFRGTIDSTGTSNSTLLVSYTQSSALLKQGHVNHIAISAKGPSMTFYVNGQKLKVLIDNTYTSGSIALFVSNLPHTTPGAQAIFSKLAIYPPQS